MAMLTTTRAVTESSPPRPPRATGRRVSPAVSSIKLFKLFISTRESHGREAASPEKEKIPPSKSLIQLEELNQSYENILEIEEQALDGSLKEFLAVARARLARLARLNPNERSHAEASLLLYDAFESKIEKLDLNNQFVPRMPEFLGRVVTLISLDISNNQLQMLPNSIANLVNLESLNAKSNQLKTLPNSIGLLAKLKYLDVSSNVLNHLPESLGQCSCLVEVDAHFNQLQIISANFGFMLVNLEKLELHLNMLSFLPASICQLKSLTYLDLHMNKLKGLPASFGNLSQVEYLDLSSNFNDLLVLPESMGDLISLTYCDLSFNQIRDLPDSLGRLEKLGTLRLDGNPLVAPPMEVVERGHDAVMGYLQERWISGSHRDLQISGGVNGCSPPRGGNDYNPLLPAWAGNSALSAWMGSICGSFQTLLCGGTGKLLTFQRFEQPL